MSSLSLCRTLPHLSAALLLATLTPTLHAQGAGFWHTSGNHILDSNNQIVRIAGINWYGLETVRAVPGGLTTQDFRSILHTIQAQGYNTIRIPFSNQMVEQPSIPSAISFANGLNANLQGLNSLQILDQIVAVAGTLNLRIILDNHRSEAGDSAESNGLWFTGAFPETAWINDWSTLAIRYAGNPTVIGVDLRNEPHNATQGGACWDCGGANDWHLAAARAGNAVLAINPNLLVFVEGTDAYNNDYTWWGGNLEGVQNSPVQLSVANHLVYSPHEYGPREYQQWWFNGSTSYSTLYSVWLNHWGYISQNGLAPIWLGEFGTTNIASDLQNNSPGSQGQYFQSLIQFLGSDSSLNWTYWALNGEDAYGLLDSNYDPSPVSALKQQSLASLQFAFGTAITTSPAPTAPVTDPNNPTPDPNNPAPPTSLVAAAASATTVNLSWQPSPTPGVTYTLYRSTTPNFPPSSPAVLQVGITATSFTATLDANTTWYFIVQAVQNGYGSPYTARASATTPAADTTSPTTPTQPTATVACHVSFTDTNDWGSGFTGSVAITNTGATALSGWTLIWINPGNQQLTQSWSSTFSQTGQTVSLFAADWNAAIAPGATVSGIGFNAAYTGANPIPNAFYLNGVLCQ